MSAPERFDNPSDTNLQIVISAKARHAILWEARKLFKSQKEMADFLGISQQLAGLMLNLKWFCDLKQERFSTNPKWISVFQKLMDLTGRNIYEIFPEELAGKKIENQIEVTRDVPIQDLIETVEEPVYFPEKEYDRKELARQIDKILQTLTPREEKVIRMRFGLGDHPEHTLEEVGQDFEVTRERLRQIEKKALNKLRHPSRSKRLRAFIEAPIVPKRKNISGTQRFTFPVFAKNRRDPQAPLVPVGLTTFPNINMTTVPEGFNTVRLMVPFSNNLGALLPINFSAVRKCLTLPALFELSQKIAIKKNLIHSPGLTEEEWVDATKSSSRTELSTGSVRSCGKQLADEDSLFAFLAVKSNNWWPRRGFLCENLTIPFFHEVEILEHKTPHITFLYLPDIGITPSKSSRIHFRFRWNLPEIDKNTRKAEREEDLQQANEGLLPRIREKVLADVGFDPDRLNHTEWFFEFDGAFDIMRSIAHLERCFPEIEREYLELINSAAKRRNDENKARSRENQERWRRELEQKRLTEESLRKKKEEFLQKLTLESLETLDPLTILNLAFECEFRIKDLPRAIFLYQLSAEKGCPEGQYQLSQKYLHGIGVKADILEAVRLLRLAAAQGFGEAEYVLARMYEFGKGVKQDQLTAVSLYHLAGVKGHPQALLRLGEKYEAGDGIPQDIDQAELCYRDAIEFGSPGAVSNLERLLYRKNNPSLSEKTN